MSANRPPRVVVGVDDSLAGLQALRFAVAEARRRGVTVRAVRVWQLRAVWYGLDLGQYRTDLADAAAATIVTAFRLAMGGLPSDIVVEALALEGATPSVLVDQADGPDDLLVVGRSRHGIFHVAGVDVHCVRSARCPVVTVGGPALAPARGAREVVSAAEVLLREAASNGPRRTG
jgi:nucleotide-binding universal stress UspA family protein